MASSLAISRTVFQQPEDGHGLPQAISCKVVLSAIIYNILEQTAPDHWGTGFKSSSFLYETFVYIIIQVFHVPSEKTEVFSSLGTNPPKRNDH